MTKFSLKSVFSAPLIIFSPFRKLKLNGFLGGLIFGAIFSLVVNMVTVQVQEMIQKQRILEAVENEIMSNTLSAKSIVENIGNIFKKKESPNIFHPFFRYSNDLWTQSTEPLQYISQLEPDIQSSIYIYYTVTTKHMNNMVDKYNEIAQKKLENCYEFSKLNSSEKENCNQVYWEILNLESESAGKMGTEGFNLLEKFHPTQDRLNSPILKLFMGDKSVRFLSGK